MLKAQISIKVMQQFFHNFLVSILHLQYILCIFSKFEAGISFQTTNYSKYWSFFFHHLIYDFVNIYYGTRGLSVTSISASDGGLMRFNGLLCRAPSRPTHCLTLAEILASGSKRSGSAPSDSTFNQRQCRRKQKNKQQPCHLLAPAPVLLIANNPIQSAS